MNTQGLIISEPPVLSNVYDNWKLVNMRDVPLGYNTTLNIASATGSDTQDIAIGFKDFMVVDLLIIGRDSIGQQVGAPTIPSDNFRFQVVDQDGKSWFDSPIDIVSASKISESFLHKGFIVRNQSRLTFTITGDGFPAVPVLNYGVRFNVLLSGYELLSR